MDDDDLECSQKALFQRVFSNIKIKQEQMGEIFSENSMKMLDDEEEETEFDEMVRGERGCGGNISNIHYVHSSTQYICVKSHILHVVLTIKQNKYS